MFHSTVPVRRSATAAFLSLMITLSACGQTPLTSAPAPAPAAAETAEIPATLTLSPDAQANQDRTLGVAAARGLSVLSQVTLEEAGVPTSYLEATTAAGEPVMLLGTVEAGAPRYAELRTLPAGQSGNGGAPFVITGLTAQGTVATGLAAQGVSDWVFNKLVYLINKYKHSPRWLKAALKGPIRGVIKLIIGEAISRGCTYAFNTLARKLHASGRWVPLSRDLLCEIIV
ncbi:hypothetical protein [Deinococcus frigens]|uniref:hypothetical protein n=1 Tax=Deinococcus frigens TaxID=249403 RepID=UPI0004957A16|nr:hypothetical protein [Deinococcus frigens]